MMKKKNVRLRPPCPGDMGRVVSSEKHRSFGKWLVAETWELRL